MHKVTFLGLKDQKESFIKRLQEVGITHLILPREGAEPYDVSRELQRVAEVRKFLARRAPKQPGSQGSADYAAIVAKRESLGQEEARLSSDLTALKKDRAVLEPWGEFAVADLERLRAQGLVVQFFRVSPRLMPNLPLAEVCHQVIRETEGEVAFVTLGREPLSLGLLPERLPDRSLAQTEDLIAEKDARLAEITGEYTVLAEKLSALQRAEAELTDEVEYRRALLNSPSELDDRLFVVKCWSPVDDQTLAKQIGGGFVLFHFSEEAQEGDRVPVLLSNKAAFAPGEDLVNVYSTPNISDFDPSGIVLYCFVIFYGMIIGDAGYGVVLTALTVWLHKKFKEPTPLVKRMIRLSYLLGLSTIIFGVISASYFGIALAAGNPLNKVMLLDLGSKEGQSKVMLVSIIMGMIHISLALAIKLYRTRDWTALGWIIAIWSGYVLLDSKMVQHTDNPVAQWILIAGLALVVLFTSNNKNPIVRILAGLNGVLGIIQLFADVLSYMRLFALGLATMYMCQTFNMLGEMTYNAVPYVGAVFAALVLVGGHAINIVLGIMGGVVHGLRLNFLEWYRWCFEGDGLPFKPFRQIAK